DRNAIGHPAWRAGRKVSAMGLRPMTDELVNEYVSIGAWRQETFWQIVEQNAHDRPTAPAVADQHRRLTYDELRREVYRLGAFLEGLDLPQGSSVGLQATNSISIPICHLACNYAGLMFVPFSSAWRER